MMVFREISRDMKKISFGTSMKKMKIPLEKVVLPEKKTKVLRLNHMSHHCIQHASSLHNSKKKLPLKCHHNEI